MTAEPYKARDGVRVSIDMTHGASGGQIVAYDIVVDQHVYEHGYRLTWDAAMSRVGDALHELANINRAPWEKP